MAKRSYVQDIRNKPGTRARFTPFRKLADDEAREEELRKDPVRKRKLIALLRAKDAEMERDHRYAMTHYCPVHFLVLSKSGECAICGLGYVKSVVQ